MQTNCPNCGAPIKHYYNHNCEYCGTFLNNTNEEIKRFKNCKLNNVKVFLDIHPETYNVVISIRAVTSPKILYLEEISDDSMIVSSENLGKSIGFRIAIPIFELRNYTYNEFIYKISDSLPEPFLEHRSEIMSQIVELLNNSCISTRWL